MATKPKADWAKIRAEWESNNQDGYVWLATKYGVDKSNLSRRIKSEGWVKNTTESTTISDATLIEIEAVELQPATTEKQPVTTELQPPKMGRPTKFKPEYCQQIINHFSDNESYVVLNNDDDETKRKAFLNRPITMYGFAQKIGVDVDTVANWANARDENGALENPDFFGAYKAAMTMQAAMILEGGIAGVYNPNISALILKNNHGFRDVQTVEHDIVQTKEFESKLDAIFEKTLKKSLDAQEGLKDRFSRIIEGEKL